MRPVSAAEARDFIKASRAEEERQRKSLQEAEAAVNERPPEISMEDEFPERDLKPTVEFMEGLAEKVDAEESSIDQGDLLVSEIKRVNQFKKAASLEEYLLKKYRLTLLQREFGDMKADARVALQALAKEQKLYRIVD